MQSPHQADDRNQPLLASRHGGVREAQCNPFTKERRRQIYDTYWTSNETNSRRLAPQALIWCRVWLGVFL